MSACKKLSFEEYYPFGGSSYHSVGSQVDVSDKRYRYNGKEKDTESGLYYYGARYYAPWLGRWMSADPAGSEGSGLNMYWFNSGNPINRVDMDGMKDEDLFTFENILQKPLINESKKNETTKIDNTKVNLQDKNNYKSYKDDNSLPSTIFYIDDFENQAEYFKNKLLEKYDSDSEINLVRVNKASEFVKEWNNLSDSTKEVMIISHSNFHSLIFENGSSTNALSSDGLGFPNPSTDDRTVLDVKFSDLSSKYINTLTIHGCNSGLTDADSTKKFGYNLQHAFLNYNDVDTVRAWDGSVGFGPGKILGLFSDEYYARLSNIQTSIDGLLKKVHVLPRPPKGLQTITKRDRRK